jgi:hypothetical protein
MHTNKKLVVLPGREDDQPGKTHPSTDAATVILYYGSGTQTVVPTTPIA